MTIATMTPQDTKLREAVLSQLTSDPAVDASDVGVIAREHVVTLSGFIDTYAGKLAAERAAKQVAGVRAVANELQVRLRLARADDEIARDAARLLDLRRGMPDDVQAVVHHGHVTLTGSVPWLVQRTSAENAVRQIRGVVEVINRIVVTPTVSAENVAHLVTDALHRIADLDARQVSVVISGATVLLGGRVTSWAQRDAVERAASAAPGVARIVNHIDVAPRAL